MTFTNGMPMILNHFLVVLPLLTKISLDDFGITLFDKEKVIWDSEDNIVFGFEKATYLGEPVVPETPAYRAMLLKKRVVEEIPKGVFGINQVAHACVALPIFEEGKVVGSVEFYHSLNKRELLIEIAESLENSMKTLDSTIQRIAAEAEELSATGQELSRISEETNNCVSETDKMIHVISNIAKQTNLIGLNAAIEAARVGEHGRGFAVVANEVRKLAQDSSVSTKTIKQTLSQVKEAVEQINSAIMEVSTVVYHQAEELTEITSLADELARLSKSILSMAQSLSKDNLSQS